MARMSCAAYIGSILALVLSAQAQVGQSPFLPRYQPCPCLDSCIYAFSDPQLANFPLPDRGNQAAQLNVGNPIVSADGTRLSAACDGDDSAYLNDNLEWVTTVTDNDGNPRDIDVFVGSGDVFLTREIDNEVFEGYYEELSGRLVRTELTCNDGDRGCVYFTVGADDFVCPCPIDLTVDLTVDQELLGGVELMEPSEGMGYGRVQYDPLTRLMQWEIETMDLSSDLVQLHFHGPASPIVGGPLQINATDVGNPPLGRTGTISLNETQGRDLVNGLWYINVHTELNPSGELRGNIRKPDISVDLTVDHELLGGIELLAPSVGSGIGNLNYDPTTRLLSWYINAYDLSSDLVQIHFHGPATPIEAGALQVNATAVGIPPLGMVGAVTLDEIQGRDFEAGLWYINVHTADNPSGELRGNIIEPDAIINCTVEDEIAGGVELLADSQGYGTGRLNYNETSRLLVWDIRTQNLAGDLQQLHFHGPAATNEGGDLQINATMVGVPPFGMVGAATLTPEQADALLNEMWYINVHTVVNPSGELRGNILAPALDSPPRVNDAAVNGNNGDFPLVPVVAGAAGGGGACCIALAIVFFLRRKKRNPRESKARFRSARRETPRRRLSGDGPEEDRPLAGKPKRPSVERVALQHDHNNGIVYSPSATQRRSVVQRVPSMQQDGNSLAYQIHQQLSQTQYASGTPDNAGQLSQTQYASGTPDNVGQLSQTQYASGTPEFNTFSQTVPAPPAGAPYYQRTGESFTASQTRSSFGYTGGNPSPQSTASESVTYDAHDPAFYQSAPVQSGQVPAPPTISEAVTPVPPAFPPTRQVRRGPTRFLTRHAKGSEQV